MTRWGTKREGRNEVSSLVLRFDSLYLDNFHLHLLQWKYISGKKTKSVSSQSQFKTFPSGQHVVLFQQHPVDGLYILYVYIYYLPQIWSQRLQFRGCFWQQKWLLLANQIVPLSAANLTGAQLQMYNGRLMVTIAVERSYTHSGQIIT